MLWLEHRGVTFHRNPEGKLGTRAFGGASAARTYYVADITGQALLHVLYEQLMKVHAQIDRYEEWFVTALVQDDEGNCCGAVARNIRDGAMELFARQGRDPGLRRRRPVLQADDERADLHGRRDRAVLPHRRAADGHGDDPVPPDHAGRERDPDHRGRARRGRAPLQRRGRALHGEYAPNKLELASRDVVSRSEQTEINEGRGFPDGTVALDITKVPRKRTLEALREIVNIGRDFAGVDITREPIHIKPGCHYIMGGVKTDVWGATDDPRPLRRRRGRLRLGPRRQPPRRQLAAGHADLRPPLGRARRPARRRHDACRSASRAALADERAHDRRDPRAASRAAGGSPRSRTSSAR